MKNLKKEAWQYVIFYFVLFFILPFIILGTGTILKGLEMFFLYMLVIYPVTYGIFLWRYRKMFKNKIENYVKLLFTIWAIFIFSIISVPIYFYILTAIIVSGSRFGL